MWDLRGYTGVGQFLEGTMHAELHVWRVDYHHIEDFIEQGTGTETQRSEDRSKPIKTLI